MMKTETRKDETMKTHETEQVAYAGQFSIRDMADGQLLHGGGAVAPRPRLYETAEAAKEAAAAITWVNCEAVKLVANSQQLKAGLETLAALLKEAWEPGEPALPEGFEDILEACDHNLVDEHFRLAILAAGGDVAATAELRTMLGLPLIV